MRKSIPSCLLIIGSISVEAWTGLVDSTEPIAVDPDAPTQTWIDSLQPSSPTFWSLPPTFSNMSPFKVSSFAAGATNLAILKGSPTDSTSESADPQSAFSSNQLGWNESINSLQILYPKGSTAPRNHPQGGTEFYAQPLDLSTAQNASLKYSVYFPPDFEWVKGGKLPGLYGGHKGCSGGNAAIDTRLMWRASGDGELYLYVPKDKQTPELCNLPPRSICDSDYGLSIGRGAWKFAQGGWTTVQQDVWLNTPGINDGGFNIWVNGQLVLSYDQVRYRETAGECATQTESDDASMPSSSSHAIEPEPPVVNQAIDSFIASGDTALTSESLQPQSPAPTIDTLASPIIRRDYPWDQAMYQPSTPSTEQSSLGSSGINSVDVFPFKVGHAPPPPGTGCAVGFIGLFFSTFFGGHTADWAPSQDQYTYFKDFEMSVHV